MPQCKPPRGRPTRNMNEPSIATRFHPQRLPRPDCATPESGCRPRRVNGLIALVASAIALVGFLHTLPAQAVEFRTGGLQGSVDTTISHGMTFRVEDRDETLAGKTNSNDGNLNYDRGIVSNTSKFTTDLDLRAGEMGAFVPHHGFHRPREPERRAGPHPAERRGEGTGRKEFRRARRLRHRRVRGRGHAHRPADR